MWSRLRNENALLMGSIVGILVTLFVLSMSQPVHAQDEGENVSGALGLAAVGPVAEPHNFPVWYIDTTGLQLELCLDANPMCLINDPDDEFALDLDSFDPPLDPVFGEAFWWVGEAEIEAGEFTALLVLALEATWFGDDISDHVVREGFQNVFGRVRARVDVPGPGTYEVTHPFGVITRVISQEEFDANVDPDTNIYRRGINFTEDLGCVEAPCDFEATLDNITNIGPFLLPSNASGGDPLPPISMDGNLYIADPNDVSFVTGSPTNNNFFRVVYVDTGGDIFTDQFSLMGKIFSLPLVDPVAQLVTFYRDELGEGAVDFQIPAPLGALTAHAVGVGEELPSEPIELTLMEGVFAGSVLINVAHDLPSQVEVTFNLGLSSENTQMFPLTDRIVGWTEEGGADLTMLPTITGRTLRAASSNQWDQNPRDGSLMPTLVVTDNDGVELGTIPGAGGSLTISGPRRESLTVTSVAADGELDPAGGVFTFLNVPQVGSPGTLLPLLLDE